MQESSLITNSDTSEELTQQEKKALNAIELMIDANNHKNFEKLSNILIKYPIELLQKLSDSSSKLKDFCQNNTEFHEAIASSLQNYDYINVEIISMDSKEHFNLFAIFTAACYFSQYYANLPEARTSKKAKIRCMQGFEVACQLGLYQALTARCDQNITLLLSQVTANESKEKAITSILHDTKRLANLYWGMGYRQAGCILQDLVEKMTLFWEEKNRTTILHEESIKNFLCASFLESHPTSARIELSLTKGKGYISYMMDRGFKTHASWDEAKTELRKQVNDDAIYERLLNAAKLEIDTILFKE